MSFLKVWYEQYTCLSLMFILVQISIDSSFFFPYLFVFVRVWVSEICSHIIINQCKVLDRDHSNGCKKGKGSFSPFLKVWQWNIIHACFAAVPNRDIYRRSDWWWSFELKHDLLIVRKETGSIFANCFLLLRNKRTKMPVPNGSKFSRGVTSGQ